MRYIIAYDIEKDGARNKAAKLLGECGVRIQKSVFDCKLSKPELKKLKNDLKELINDKKDSVLFLFICDKCYAKRSFLGVSYSEKIVNSLFV